ncbi:hypothetical protein GCM10009093_14250 [Brevundimonas terrae]|uniref:Uncharacterized protein n=1 Tax=Brevundimonas terrae TaxID=363631 RepID=A0ABN0YA82_9CAUL
MAILHNYTARTKGEGRAEDGTDVLRIGQLVQHDQNPFSRFGQILERDAFERLTFEDEALMDGAWGENSIQFMGINDFDSVPVGQILRLNFLCTVGCDDESTRSTACRIGQSG